MLLVLGVQLAFVHLQVLTRLEQLSSAGQQIGNCGKPKELVTMLSVRKFVLTAQLDGMKDTAIHREPVGVKQRRQRAIAGSGGRPAILHYRTIPDQVRWRLLIIWHVGITATRHQE